MPDIYTILQLLLSLVGGMVGAFAWGRFFHKKEKRLFKNIRRPMLVIGTEDKPMTHESQLLRRVGFFNITNPAPESRAADLMNGNRLVVIGYTPNSTIFQELFKAAKQREIPVIVYAGPTRILPEDMELLQSYSHHSMCNTPLRLISDVFALMSTYPEEHND